MFSTGVFGKTKSLPAKDLASQLSPQIVSPSWGAAIPFPV